MENIINLIGIIVFGAIVYSLGFNSGCIYLLDIYEGKRKVKWSKNPFKK